MKKEASVKNKKWLWLVLALVAVVAVAGVVLALVLGGGAGNTDKNAGGRPDLYWNVGRQSHLDPVTGLSNREAAADGLFYVTFAHNGEQVEYAVADKKTINYIDSMDVMGLVLDNDDMVVDVIAPADIGTVISTSVYVQRADANMIVANSTITMNGMMYNLKITDQTEVYDVTGNGEFEGVKVDPATVGTMATIAVYGDSEKQATHIYVKSYPVESKIYWRADQLYNSTDKVTTREVGEDGAYAIPFFCDGELVTLKCKDKDIVTSIDKVSWNYPHFGFRFDEDGYIVEVVNSGIASRTVLSCQAYDITQYDGQYFTATRLLKNDGQFVEGAITENTAIYDVSTAAKADGIAGRRVDSLQMGDRVCVWKDADGNVVLIYISVRLIDGPAYYRPTRKYSSTTAATTRKPNAQGVYEIELLREGDTEKKIYKTTDLAIATAVDQPKDNVLGLKVDENNNIISVYDVYSLFGNGNFCRGRYVSDVTGNIANFSTATSTKGGILAADCKVYNVSAIGDYGKETTLQLGDYVYAYKQPSGEIIHLYVIRRYTGEDTMYFNLERLYDTEAKKSTRMPDADGWYWFDMMVQAKQVRLKTKDIEIVNAIDAIEIRITALLVQGNVITDVVAAQYGTGGAKGLSGYCITSINADGTVDAKHASNGKEGSFKMAEDCEIYNVSQNFDKYVGERTTLKIGDMITAYHNMLGEAKVIFVRQRETKDMYWKYDRYYDSTNEVTLREPDADGWYWYKMTVNGKTVTLKTQDKKVATAVDYQSGGFGLNLDGDVIKGCISPGWIKNVYGLGYSEYTVTKINGSKVTLTYTYPSAKTTGKVVEIVLDKNVKIYDVSDTNSSNFGKEAKLQVGDVIRTYNSEDKETQTYVYIRAHATRKGGYMSYCDHCDQVVYWNPYIGSIAAYDGHYYLANDRENTASQNLGTTARDFETVIDLNGHTLSRYNGRALRVYRNETLTIMDSVGGGKVICAAEGWLGGVVHISEGGTLNLYGGTLEQVADENLKHGRGGVVYMASTTSTFNMYGGTLANGRVYAKGDDYAAGGNFYASNGTFNMYGGTITGGQVFNGSYEKVNADGTTTTETLYSYGGNIYLSGSVVANITGGTIENGYADRYGGNIAILNSKVKMNIENATITGGETLRYGGNIYGYGTIVLGNGAVVSNGYSNISGGNIYSSPSHITLKGNAKVIDGKAKSYGGNIYCSYEGSLTVTENALISGGVAKSNGGNIHVNANGTTSSGAPRQYTLNVSGGTITKGCSTGANGGNIYTGGGFVNISGGKITDGLCETSGKVSGNLYIIADEFNLSGGTISGGKVVDTEYDIFISNQTKYMSISGGTVEGRFRINCPYTIDISGAPVLKNVDLFKGATDNGTINAMLTVGEMKEGASIALKCAHSSKIFTNAFDKAAEYAAAGYFKNVEGGALALADADNRLYLIDTIEIPEIPEIVNTKERCPHCGELWSEIEIPEENIISELTEQKVFDVSGHYKLGDNIASSSINNMLTMADGVDIVLDMNGYSISQNKNSRVFYFAEKTNSRFYLLNTSDTISTVNNKATTVAGGSIYANGENLDVHIYDVTINGSSSTSYDGYGGCVGVTGNATVTMHSGIINGGAENSSKKDTAAVCISGDNGTFTMVGGTINATTGKHAIATRTGSYVNQVINILGGVVNGSVYATDNADNGIIIAGNPVISKLDLSNGFVASFGELTEGAAIAVSGDGVFTNVLNNAAGYLAYVTAYDNGKIIEVTAENTLTIEEDSTQTPETPETPETPNTKEVCPHCLKTWAELEANNEIIELAGIEGATSTNRHVIKEGNTYSESGHYRLMGNITGTNSTPLVVDIDDAWVVIDMNGYSITTTTARSFALGSTRTDTQVWLLDSDKDDNSNTVGTLTNTVKKSDGAAFYTGKSGNTVNIYDIVINGTTDSTFQSKGSGIYVTASSTVNMYSGVINGFVGTTDKNYGVVALGNSATFNMYGGTVNGVDGIHAISNIKDAAKVTINIAGGTVNGSVYLDTNTENAVSVSGAPVITNLDLTNGALVTVGALTEGAEITVNVADSVPFTDVLDNAASYTGYFKGTGNHTGALVNADNKLIITTVCPHCGVAMADITWAELDCGTTALQLSITKDTVAEKGEHYRLMSNLVYTGSTGNAFVVGTSDNGETGKVDIILDMNGFSIERTAGKYRTIYVHPYNRLVLADFNGDGDAATVGQLKSVGTLAGSTLYVDKYATLDMYDITVNGTTSSATTDGGAVGIYTNAVMNLYSGTITAGNTTGNGTAVGVGGSGKVATFNIYGGTITGSVYDRSGNGTIYVEGAPVIAELDLTNGADVDLGTLKEGASIGVSAADNTPFTVAMENAADYLEYINAVATGKTVSVDANNCLVIVDEVATASETQSQSVFAVVLRSVANFFGFQL